MSDARGVSEQDAADEAPGALELVRAFVNTLDIEERTDAIATPDLLGEWLVARELAAADERCGPGDVERAVGVREALRSMLVANGGGPVDAGALAVLNNEAERTRPTIRFGDRGSGSIGRGEGSFDDAVGRLLGIVHDAMVEGTWSRLKVCGADTCRWAVFDHSKNRSRRWCSMAECGGRVKAREYWRRHHDPRHAPEVLPADERGSADSPDSAHERSTGWLARRAEAPTRSVRSFGNEGTDRRGGAASDAV